jgi:hypothetical protein
VEIAIGTRKGLWLASDSEGTWRLDGPHFPMSEVTALLWQPGSGAPRLLAGVMSPHWGAKVSASEDLG